MFFVRPTVVSACLLGLSLSLTGCGGAAGNRDQPVPEISRAEAIDAQPATKPTHVGGRRTYTGISLNIPTDWRELPDQQMVDSKYIATTEKGELEVTLTSMGGGIDANIGRWEGQIQHGSADEPKRDTISIAGLTGTLIDCRGKYNSNVATTNSGTKDDWRLIGIGLPVPGRDFFVRVVGPREAMVEFYDPLMLFLKTAELSR